ncbi:hypothetical protein F2P79_009190 [Pimephales promelas]|nr:hypothetical protein F2P79_009190 [Pimephales promelas]
MDYVDIDEKMSDEKIVTTVIIMLERRKRLSNFRHQVESSDEEWHPSTSQRCKLSVSSLFFTFSILFRTLQFTRGWWHQKLGMD